MRHSDLTRYFSAVLKRHRAEKGLSQEALSEKAGCDWTMISLIERGIRNPTLNLSDSLAKGLGIPLSQLIKEAEDLRAKEQPKKTR